MKASNALIVAIVLGAGVWIARSESFERETDPQAYWLKQVAKRRGEVELDRTAIGVVGNEIRRRRANLRFDLADDMLIAGSDSEVAKTLRDLTIEEYQAGIDSLVERAQFLRAELATAESSLAYAEKQAKPAVP